MFARNKYFEKNESFRSGRLRLGQDITGAFERLVESFPRVCMTTRSCECPNWSLAVGVVEHSIPLRTLRQGGGFAPPWQGCRRAVGCRT